MEQLESIKKTSDESFYWLASDLANELKIDFSNLLSIISEYIIKFRLNKQDPTLHFVDINNDYQLSQYACYLIVDKIIIENLEYKGAIKKYFYTKDFNGWNIQKVLAHEGVDKKRYTKDREIWNTRYGVNIGKEIDGKRQYARPVIVLKTIGGLSLVAPLSKQGKEGPHPAAGLYHKISSVIFKDKAGNDISSFVVLNQIKVLDKKRFINKMAKIDIEEFNILKKLLRDMYFPEV